MKIRFAENALRCRVTRQAFDGLLAGRSTALEVQLPRNHLFRLSIRPVLMGGWQLESDPTGIWLSIPRADLEALAATLPSKAGLKHRFATANGSQLAVAFEVDLTDG